jgi:hypothetical protein
MQTLHLREQNFNDQNKILRPIFISFDLHILELSSYCSQVIFQWSCHKNRSAMYYNAF